MTTLCWQYCVGSPLPDGEPEDGGVSPPEYHQRRGRPQTKRIASKGEKSRKRIHCGNCKELGNHNKKSCRNHLA